MVDSGRKTASYLVDYKKEPLLPQEVSSSKQERPPLLSSPKARFLPIPPPKLVDSWRIEGEGRDLHLHQADSHVPLIHLRDLSLGLPCGEPRHIVVLLVIRGVFGSPQFGCGCVPQAHCKGSGFRLEGFQ